METVFTLSIIGWILTFIGWGLNLSNMKNYTKTKNTIAIISFSIGLILFVISMTICFTML